MNHDGNAAVHDFALATCDVFVLFVNRKSSGPYVSVLFVNRKSCGPVGGPGDNGEG